MMSVLAGDGVSIEVPVPVAPRKPRLDSRRRRELAGLWLLGLGLPDDRARVEELAPFVARYPTGSAMRTAADRLVRAGELPYRENVEQECHRVANEAARWLQACGQAVTAERVSQLLPHVGQFTPGSPLARIADSLVSAGQTPSVGRVLQIFRTRRSHALQRANQATTLVEDPEFVSRATAMISAHWHEHGTGPSWGELRRDLGIQRSMLHTVIAKLAAAGYVRYDRAPGSLVCVEHDEAPRADDEGRPVDCADPGPTARDDDHDDVELVS